mmetsp:Transcript_6727/g.10770  ORF Transcript_6727/g.10770 Transcript_6727/m.10770 type:complete len:89 (-) Transcript_6727:104-370(-)
MQCPGDAMNEFVQKQSVGTMLARITARSKGLPAPFAQGNCVKNEPTGKSWTIFKDDRNFLWHDNVFFCQGGPVLVVSGLCVLVCRYLK